MNYLELPLPESMLLEPGAAYALRSSRPWTVTALTQQIKEVLESAPALRDLWVTGEVSNFTRSTAGHLYFTLKDGGAALSCVMWRSAAAALRWQPEQGAAALAHGSVSVYPVRGAYQLYVDQLRPAGVGDLHARFEELRERLKAEGLFDPARKRPLPAFPRCLGIVTSPQAAAYRDVLNILERRYPLVRVLLAPTLVQGEGAPPQIVAALRALDARDEVDLILLVRGGGSLEDLWAFSDEGVARAVAGCRHPVVCGVGHETDFTIADFAADLRAPTPSAAAELSVPDRAELRQHVAGWVAQLEAGFARLLAQAQLAVDGQKRALQCVSPQARIATHRQQSDDLVGRAARSVAHAQALHRAGLNALSSRLTTLGPLATLERGYAIVRLQASGTIVASVVQVHPGDALEVQVRDGQFGVVARAEET